VTVTRVVDGDTLKIRYENDTTDTVRLLGIDTPEIHSENTPDEFEGVPDTDAGRACLERYGEEASAYLDELVEGERVRLEFDEQSDRRGYYGRLLAYVHHDGENLNHQLVTDGWARVYDSRFEQQESFYDAEASAQRQSRRVWSCRDVSTPTPTPEPSSGEGGDLSISRVHADAEGNDHENENDEYIVFKNSGDSTLDISGWTVKDEADHTYVVPDGVTVEAGATITLYTGSGTDTKTELYWGSDAAIWNNGGDTISVRDDSGTLVIEYEYP
jgi:micrococcal nuclease